MQSKVLLCTEAYQAEGHEETFDEYSQIPSDQAVNGLAALATAMASNSA